MVECLSALSVLVYYMSYIVPVVIKTVGLIPCQPSFRNELHLLDFCETQSARFCFGSVIFLQITGKSG